MSRYTLSQANHDHPVENLPACVTPESSEISSYIDQNDCVSPSTISDGQENQDARPRRPRWRLRPTITLAPPVIGADVLEGSPVGFLEFLLDDSFEAYRIALFAEDHTSVATAINDFRKSTEFHYFGHRSAKPGQQPPKNPGVLDASKAGSKQALKAFTQLAYRGDPEKRGPLFWKRVAGVLWDAYESLMALRRKAEKVRQQEINRNERIAKKREARAAYMRRYRAKD